MRKIDKGCRYRRVMNPMKLMDEPCPKCGLMKWYHLPVADYYRCIFCSFHKKGEFFIREAYDGQQEYCDDTDDFKNPEWIHPNP
jgi:hypothetical protein